MPGYEFPGGCLQATQDKDIHCSSCNLLIREAVQTLCGHRYCRTCVDELLTESDSKCVVQDCGENFEGDKRPNGDTVYYYPDQFVRKKVAKLVIKCKFYERNCPWTGFLAEWEAHLTKCQYGDRSCPDCSANIDNSKWDEHQQTCPGKLKPCPLAEYGCPNKELMPPKELQRHHLQESVAHTQLLVDWFKTMKQSSQRPQEQLIFPKSMDSGFESMAAAVADGTKNRTDVEEVDAPNVYHPPTTSAQKLPLNLGDLQFEEIVSQLADQNLLQRVQGMETRNKQLEDELQRKSKEVSDMQARMAAMEDKCKKLERNYEDVNFRLMLEESHSHQGDMIWRIPNFTQRQDDAKSGKFTSIYSLPFYTHRYGYKMCLRLYPFGDGAGRGTHLSLFIVVMKGDFDEILEWPFKHKVTFQLLNQNGGKDIVDAFRADPQSSSFRKPISDMNIATGCPKFAPLDDLQKQGFVSGDLLFVRAKVEPFNGSKLSPV